ncbi:unnamed protein product [Effrenium voratum]|nr:unnamed protein product [Effrenium voratum]
MAFIALALFTLAAAHSGTCPATKKCGEGAEAGLPCCQVDSTKFECCSSSEACIPKVGCRCLDLEAEAPLYEGYDFAAFCEEFSRAYGTEEFERRRSIFQTNLEKIKAHNTEFQAGLHTWYMAVNDFADWSQEEFKGIRATQTPPPLQAVHTVQFGAAKANPETMDWRTKGVVTPVKNQGGCGSCWAFSATETVESHFAIASGHLLTLAPQTYVDCVVNTQDCGGTGGCEGAIMEEAFNLTISKGIALESDLPYQGVDETCKPYKAAVKAQAFVKLPVNDASSLETALATKGPVSVTVAAGSWQLYGGGIFDGCSKDSDNTLDHGVQAVGYTSDSWIVRNSWGPSWGEEGYIRLSRASDSKTFVDKKPADGSACKPYPKTQTIGGECGVLFDTSYPVGLTAGDQELVV